MGKIQNRRKKYHLKASKPKEVKGDTEQMESVPTMMNFSGESSVKPLAASSSLFKGIDISPVALQQQLMEFDQKSVASRRSTASINPLPKKEKRKIKKELFLKKIETIKEAVKEEKAKKKRKMTPVVGDMKPLEDALPTLDILLKDIEASRKQKRSSESDAKPIGCRSFKAQQNAMLQHITLFNQILAHPSFQSNPEERIKACIENRLAD